VVFSFYSSLGGGEGRVSTHFLKKKKLKEKKEWKINFFATVSGGFLENVT
jgi:Uri superfamily endonuclease